MAIDAQGRLYMTDSIDNMVQVWTRNGKQVAVFGGVGIGPAHFSKPSGIAVDAQGNIYVTERGNHRIQKFGPLATD